MTHAWRGPRIFASLVESFISSPQFQNLSENTKDLWGRELRHAGDLDNLGIFSLKEIRPSLVQKYLDGLNGRPGKQAAAKAALKAIEKWAVVRDLLQRPITLGVATGHPEGGHIPWTEAQVRCAEHVSRSDVARAITLGAATGQRISDLVRMGRGDIETYKGREGINVTQKKTGRTLWIPINERLAAAMATWERRDVGPFLTRSDGRPWKSEYLTDAWEYEKQRNPELAEHRALGLVLHGLRGHCCVRLCRDGLTDHQISDIVGMSIPMVGRYTRLSSQKDNALAAIGRTKRD